MAGTFAVVVVFYLAAQFAMRVPDAGWKSGTLGFTLFLVGLGLFHVLGVMASFFVPTPDTDAGLVWAANLIFAITMAAFVPLVESELARNAPEASGSFPYTTSVVTIAGVAALAIVLTLLDLDLTLVFIFVVFPFIRASALFMDQFRSLQVVQAGKPGRFFFLGLSLAGFSNFFGIFWVWLGDWTYTIIAGCIVVGGMLMSAGADGKRTLAAGRLGGISALLKEILESHGEVQEIDHEEKKILFAHGEHVSCVLVVTESSREIRYRLERFRLDFEKKFKDALKDWTGNVAPFGASEALVREYFGK